MKPGVQSSVGSLLEQDVVHMARALELAARGLFTTDPNPRVGCVIAREGRVLGEGWHVRAGEPHAEVLALRAAGPQARGATAYVTLEPCSHTGRTPPCADALVAAGIARLVCCSADPNPRVGGSGIARLRAAGIAVSVWASAGRRGEPGGEARALGHESGVLGGEARVPDHESGVLGGEARVPGHESGASGGEVRIPGDESGAPGPGAAALANKARALNVGFFSRFERGRPWVRLKLAMSLDARTAPASGGQAWISGEESRADVQAWRARSSAVLTGAGTVRSDNPRLDVRLAYGSWVRQPLRVVLDPGLSCPSGAKIFHGDALIFAATDAPVRAEGGVRVERLQRAAGGLDLHAVLERLTALEVNELLVECGPRLAGSFVHAHLVDELILYVAPTLLGADAAPLLHISGMGAPGSLPAFEFREAMRIGADLRLTLTPKKS